MRIRHYIILPFIALMLIFGLASFSKGHLDNISIVTCIEVMEERKQPRTAAGHGDKTHLRRRNFSAERLG